MKKNLTKKIIALLMGALVFCTMFANAVFAEELLPAYDGEAVTVSLTGPAVVREEAEDGHIDILCGTAQQTLDTGHNEDGTFTLSGPAVLREEGTAETLSDGETVLAATAAAGSIAAVEPLTARIDPSHHRNDVDPDKPHTIRDDIDTAGNLFLDIASNFVPYGGSIMNYIKGKSKAKEKSTKTETVINVVTDIVCEVVPAIAEPVVNIASGVVTTLIKLFCFREDNKPENPLL